MSNPTKIKVFTYGTLRRNCINYRLMETINSTFLKEDDIYGQMFTNNKVFPFIVLDKSLKHNYKVHGEIFEVESLDELDCLEGYLKDNEQHNLYNRLKVQTLSNETVWVYEGGTYLKNSYCLQIQTGNWTNFIKELHGENIS